MSEEDAEALGEMMRQSIMEVKGKIKGKPVDVVQFYMS